jgi:hypothetical protein
MTFLFKWRHQDGSTVEFSDKGWRSDDPEKKRLVDQDERALRQLSGTIACNQNLVAGQLPDS